MYCKREEAKYWYGTVYLKKVNSGKLLYEGKLVKLLKIEVD